MSRRQPRWGPAAVGEAPQQHYLVRPRHLAGGGDLTHITAHLAGAGWKNRTDKSGSPLSFESPDKSVRVGYHSDTSPPMWVISGTPSGWPAWNATLGAAVPVEILAGLTDALAASRPTHAPDVLGQATARGWKPGTGEHPGVDHPDGTATLHYRRDGDTPIWWATAQTPAAGGHSVPLWTAGFSEHTPLHAVEGFAAALADPQPVLRPPGRIPFASAPHAAATAYAVLPSQLAAWRQARTAAGRAAAWARSTRATSRLRPRTTPIRQAVPLPPKPAAHPRPAAPTRTTHPPRSR
ncbi:DUF317 domain-containing protein [Streptomyces sp. CA-111067]|uniref:DUF317 domain-containing protein n=1 Tax=Streptomyces sp. CA-111067 TaxID=3240046 RepID=UPI003D96634A